MVSAQSPSASETAAARRLFEEGLEALEQSSWQAAHDAFQRSYELAPRTSTLLNLATAQAELGLLVEATESYRTFIAEATGRQRQHLRNAEGAMAEIESRLAHVELSIPALEPGDVIRLNGRDMPNAALEVNLPMNPDHQYRLTVHRGEDEIGSVELMLVAGETRGVSIVLHPPVAVVENPGLLESPSDDSGIWIGIGIGAGVLAIGAGIAIGVVLSQQGGGELYVGNLGPGMVTF